jgi:hypothetical protein
VEETGLNVTPRRSYWALSSQLALVRPTPLSMQDYATSTAAIPCNAFTIKADIDVHSDAMIGATGSEVKINVTLPSKPNPKLCSCMMDTLSCIPSPNATMEEIILTYNKMCLSGNSSCPGVKLNATEGRYDSFNLCNYTERASWAHQLNYIAQGNESAACSAQGGIIRQATPSASLPTDCQVLLRQAGPEGTGTITFEPATVATKSGSSSSSSRTVLKSGAKAGIVTGVCTFVILSVAIGVYIWLRKGKMGKNNLLPEAAGNGFQKAELADTQMSPAEKAQVDSIEATELPGSDGRRELRGKEVILEIEGEHTIVELPTASNEPAELDSHELKSK